MNEQEKALLMRRNLKMQIAKWDIAGFLREEINGFLAVLSSWKLEKLTVNFAMFKRFIYLLDDQNTKQLGVRYGHENYFLSQRGEKLLAKKRTKKDLDVNAHAVKILGKMKAIFVFQATEFCNGSLDRMKIVDFAKIRSTIVQKCKKI